VYAFLSEITVNLGQNVVRGQRMGLAGYYPAIKGNGLYFELRYRQNAVNPEGWFETTR
jgi:septal ring factor EnvC (AmiA/AmiB activator)